MILFYHKKTGEILGTIEGRVHFDHHMKASMSSDAFPENMVARLIIGYEDNGAHKTVPDDEGKPIEVPVYVEHNMHLWDKQLEFEDPRHPSNHTNHIVRFDKANNRLVLVPKVAKG